MEHKKEPIRVLHIVGEMGRGGIETMVMNLYRHIDRDKVQFDFLAHYGGRPAAYNDEIRAMGGRIYEMPKLKKDEQHACYWRIFEYIKALNEFFKTHTEYKIIHCHMTNTAAIYMPVAKKYGVTCLISHSHSTKGKAGMLGIVTDILQKPIYKYATDYFACSNAAAHWFYPKKIIEANRVTILANAVDAQELRFNPTTRANMRKDLGIDGKLVIGCVARFRPEKNHAFLLQVFLEILKVEPNAVLLLAGEGPTMEAIKEKARQNQIEDKVLFLGMRTDVPNLLQAIDVFTLTSFWEGLPVTGVEAQAAGLNCVVSSGVPQELDVIGRVQYLSLEDPLQNWRDALIKAAKSDRVDTYEQMCEAGYDIHTTASKMQKFYLEKANYYTGAQK